MGQKYSSCIVIFDIILGTYIRIKFLNLLFGLSEFLILYSDLVSIWTHLYVYKKNIEHMHCY